MKRPIPALDHAATQGDNLYGDTNGTGQIVSVGEDTITIKLRGLL